MRKIPTLGRRLLNQFALVAFLPLLVAGAVGVLWLVPQINYEIRIHHQELAKVVGSQVSIHLRGVERELRNLGQYLGMHHAKATDEVTEYLDSLAEETDIFEALYLVDEHKSIKAVGLPHSRVGRRQDLLGLDLSRRRFLTPAWSQGKPAWSDTFLSTVSGKSAVAYVVPLGKWDLVAEITIERLTTYVSNLPAESHLITLVLDGLGQVIASSAPEFATSHIDLKALIAAHKHDDENGQGVVELQMEGKQYLCSMVELDRFGWRVMVAQSVADALRPLRMALGTLAVGLLVALVLASLASWLLSREATRDFNRYNDHARALANGDYDRPWPEAHIREFATLSGSLQKMVKAILERESQLAASDRFLLESQQVARLGHFYHDFTSNLAITSPILDEIFGIESEPDRRLDFWLTMVHPDDREDMRESLFTRTLIQHQPHDEEYRIIRPSDQQERWVHALARVELDQDGQVTKLIGTVQDITERKQLESQLLQSQKIEAIGQLAGGVAHDINNMLNVILGFSELLLLTHPADSPDRDKLEQIQKAGIRSQEITRQLLAFSRKQIISPKPHNLNDIVQGSLKALIRLIGENISLLFRPTDDLWPVKVDAAQIDQILVNMAVNARDAMSDGGKLLVETLNRTFEEEYCRFHLDCLPGEYAELVVSDVGKGMDKKTLSHIFEPFFTTKAPGQGTGLGLATVYGIVKQHGGFINVYSEPGRGTTFRIYLPRYKGGEEVAVQEAPAVVHHGTGRILLMEDDPQVRQTAKSMLEELGYGVVSPETPSEAVLLCARPQQNFDLLITDVVMPEMSGKDLWDRIQPLQPGMGVLFISGYTSDVIVHHGVLDPGVLFLPKPFSMADLGRMVHKAMAS